MALTEIEPQRSDRHSSLDLWAEHGGRLFGVAQRLLGSVSDAEDVLQEAFIRLQSVDIGELHAPGAWLTTVVTRLSLNELTSARARRETYVGPWLPEPLADDRDQADEVVLAESVRAAFLVVLESLSPAERVAFVLHDVFGHPFADIARMLGRDDATCRKLASRARRAVAAQRKRFASDTLQRRTVAERFMDACEGRDLEGLLAILSPEVQLHTDGGGKVRQARRIVTGADRVARFLVGISTRRGGPQRTIPSVNGGPGLAWFDGLGRLVGVISIDVDGSGYVSQVSIVVNPDKLRHLDLAP